MMNQHDIVDFLIQVLNSLPSEFCDSDYSRTRSGSESSCGSSRGYMSISPPPGFDLISRNPAYKSIMDINCNFNEFESTFNRSSQSTYAPNHALLFPKVVKSAQQRRIPLLECSFCKQNRERVEVYTSHVLKDSTTGIVICPVLRAYHCPICNNDGGDHAHTKRYCPMNQDSSSSPLSSLLNSKINSAGKYVRRPTQRRRR